MTDERPDPAAELRACERRGELARAAELARELAERTTDPAGRAEALVRAAELVSQTAGAPAARPLLESGLFAARASRRPALQALVQAEQARLELAARDAATLDRAQRLLDQAERLLGKQADELRVGCRIAHYRGLLASRRGEPGASVGWLRRAYALADGDPGQRARILNSWGLQLEAWGDPDEARRLLERSLELKLELEDHYGAATTYGSLAFLHMRWGAFAEAREALARDLELTERIGARDLLPSLHARLAGALLGLGRIGGAEREAQAALELAAGSSSVPTARAAGFAWRELARVRRAQGRLDEAEAAGRGEALRRFEELRDPYGQALARLTLAEIGLDRHADGAADAGTQAQADLAAARPVFARLGAVHETAEALLVQARLDLARNRRAPAAALLRTRVLPLVERMARAAPHLRRTALELLAQTDAERGDERLEALAGLRRAETLLADAAGVTGPWTVLAARLPEDDDGERLARAATAEGGLVAWWPPDRAVALFAGPDAGERAAACRRRLARVRTAVAEGEARIDAPWPGPPRASGPAVEQALGKLDPPQPKRPARSGGRRRR
ncbi:MAG: tetratricopeptide repeat protein [Deltaproteobacteria bacterium]|nr:tetratricopeptide repeat protein [Deltaproteobacteria bacterium]